MNVGNALRLVSYTVGSMTPVNFETLYPSIEKSFVGLGDKAIWEPIANLFCIRALQIYKMKIADDVAAATAATERGAEDVEADTET